MKTPEEKYRNDPYYRKMVDQLEYYLVMAQTTPSELREMVIFACTQYEMHRPLSGLAMKNAMTSALRGLENEHPTNFIVPPPKHHGDKPMTATEEGDRGEKCQRCGMHYTTIYHIPDEVWNRIRPNKGDPEGDLYGGLLCPKCADQLARGYGITLYWEPSVGDWTDNKRLVAEEERDYYHGVCTGALKSLNDAIGETDALPRLMMLRTRLKRALHPSEMEAEHGE